MCIGISKYYAIFAILCKGLEYPWIMVSMWDLGTSTP